MSGFLHLKFFVKKKVETTLIPSIHTTIPDFSSPTFRVPGLGSRLSPMNWVQGLGYWVPPKVPGLGSHLSDMSMNLCISVVNSNCRAL